MFGKVPNGGKPAICYRGIWRTPEAVGKRGQHTKLFPCRSFGTPRSIYQFITDPNGLLSIVEPLSQGNNRIQGVFSQSERFPNPPDKSRLTPKIGRQKDTPSRWSGQSFCFLIGATPLLKCTATQPFLLHFSKQVAVLLCGICIIPNIFTENLLLHQCLVITLKHTLRI